MTTIKIGDAAKRWFSSGFMAGGVGAVDADKHTLRDAVMIRPGEALGHGLWIDDEFCASLVAAGAGVGDKGIKARFGHPNMCSEALGTFLGRWRNPRLDASGRVVGDLHLSATAAESPKGDLRKYVEELAAKEPEHFGASIVFSRDEQKEVEYALAHGATVDGEYINLAGFKSPDPRNVKNLPHARLAAVHASDLVDDPAATDGMFSGAGGLSLAAQMTEWLDTHPEVFAALAADPAMVDVLGRYPEQLKPFLARYGANTIAAADGGEDATCKECGHRFRYADQPEAGMGYVSCPKCGKPVSQDALDENKPLAAEPAKAQPNAPTPAEPDASKEAAVAALNAQLSEAMQMVAQAEKLRDEALARVGALEASLASASQARDELAEQAQKFAAESAQAIKERDEAQRKLSVLVAGEKPVSAAAAEAGNKSNTSPWKRAQR